MTGAHGVDVGLFHQSDVLHHALRGQRVAGVRINLVPVHAAQPDRPAVDQKLSVANFDFPKTDPATVRLHDTVPFSSFSVSTSV